ncbi:MULTISPECIES: short-chain dehydrogenase [unclassified Burkholderia]|uniref:short-chain dehydrogenase n=1 Tax=unclassified Burkholderia TaxID=2613784 RepID=UPI0014227F10|nr:MULTISPECIES: short-chain dehydrogenase [unclassified Burkholderia]NIE56789.1 short-chain dehydrogenase [Burkholderia sp. Ap-955]NIF13515.1 short-chain dehydrogenase [Burkholderia sp. Ax-1735]NIG06730.1 short-chain dehydrogenase [Burkholderia sp. Tr-849]
MSNARTEVTSVPPSDPEELCLQTPLYKKLKLHADQSEWLIQLEDYRGALDMYCPDCKRHTVFTGNKYPALSVTREVQPKSIRDNRLFKLEFFCPRNREHTAVFVFRVYDGTLEKIGQFPSIADIAAPHIRQYRTILGDNRFHELSRGIGLAAHGVGVGAFVYFRRIFESLIAEAKNKAASDEGWDHENFDRCHMDKKILMLKGYLPEFLVENRTAYGIMSVGVHELSDDECLIAFPVIKTGIELMLDQIIEIKNREKKIREASENLAALHSNIKLRKEELAKKSVSS